MRMSKDMLVRDAISGHNVIFMRIQHGVDRKPNQFRDFTTTLKYLYPQSIQLGKCTTTSEPDKSLSEYEMSDVPLERVETKRDKIQ